MESIQTRARARAAIVHHGAGARLSEVLAAIRGIGLADVAAFADRYLSRAQARAVLVLPDEERAGNAAAGALRKASLPGDLDSDRAGDTEDEAHDDVEGGPFPTAWDFGAARAQVSALANGLTIIALRRPGMPFVSMVLGFHGDPQPGEAPGVRTAIPRTPLWNLTPEPIDRGIFQVLGVKDDKYWEALNLFSADTDNALNLIADQPSHQHVYWPSARFQRAVDGAAQTDSSPATRAYRAFRTALVGACPYRPTPSADEMRAVTDRDVQSWLERTRRPNNGALVIVGDVDADQVSRRAERLLRDWKGDPTPVAPPPPPATAGPSQGPRPRLLFTADSRRRSTEIRFGCLLPPIQTYAQDLRSDVLADLVLHDLRRGLRFELGASYGVFLGASTLRGGTALLEGSLDLEDRALPEALALLHAWFDPARPDPIQPSDLERVRRRHARHSPFHYATNGRVAGELFYAWNLGWPLAVLDDYPNLLARVTTADLEADLNACRASAVISVLGAGPLPEEDAGSPPN